MKCASVIGLLAAVFCIGLSAQDRGIVFEGLDFSYDILLHVNTEPDSAPSPLIGTVGASARLRITDSLVFAPGLGLYANDYLNDGQKTLPAEIEYRNAATVLGIFLEAPLLFEVLAGGGPTLAVGGGPTLRPAIPIAVHGGGDGGVIVGYFYEAARLIYLEGRIEGALVLAETFSITARARALLPVYRLWDGLGLSFMHEAAFGLGIGLRYLFPR